MALILADRVRETSTTTGTGTLTLDGAVTSYQSFAAIGNANTTYYAIVNQNAAEWEVGIGTYTSSGTTLARTTVLSSSNAGSLVNFSAGTKDVWGDYPAGKAVTTDTLASPPAIGTTTPAAGSFTTLSASSTVSGAGFDTYLASPPAIGGTTAAAGTFTTLTGTTSTTTPIVQNSAAAAIAFKTNSATSAVTQFNINHTASAVNYVQVTGAATGAGVLISSQGSDAAVNLGLQAKSGGVIRFFTGNGTENFRVSSVSSTVNYIAVSGSIAGASPSFTSTGTDADIDLTLTPKGAGTVRFGTYTASALLPVAGYITIKDSGGTTRRLLVG
jgi:hypothetical protein